MSIHTLYPEIEPYLTGTLKVSDLHELYYEECGNPNGVPVVFLHGGPGSGASKASRRFFDPKYYRIVLFDQRGAPRSKPFGEMRENTPDLLVDDVEALKNHLNIDSWFVFGGSWGSTLSLIYAQKYPQSCKGLVIRGVWLFRPEDIKWFFEAPQKISPDHWKRFIEFLPESERADYFENYYKRIMSDDPAIHMPAAKAFSRFEADNSTLFPNGENASIFTDDASSLGIARTEMFYMRNNVFQNKNRILDDMHKIEHIPTKIVHGRYDYVCPIEAAFLVNSKLKNSEFLVVNDAGHSAFEPNTCSTLVRFMDEFRAL